MIENNNFPSEKGVGDVIGYGDYIRCEGPHTAQPIGIYIMTEVSHVNMADIQFPP